MKRQLREALASGRKHLHVEDAKAMKIFYQQDALFSYPAQDHEGLHVLFAKPVGEDTGNP